MSGKAKGSHSEKAVLDHAHRGLQLMAEFRPMLMGKIQSFMHEAMEPGVLGKQEKERISLGMALVRQCHYCIALHVRACKAAGVTAEEIMDVCGLAVMMGGGPVLMMMAEVERAMNEFYLDENGELV